MSYLIDLDALGSTLHASTCDLNQGHLAQVVTFLAQPNCPEIQSIILMVAAKRKSLFLIYIY